MALIVASTAHGQVATNLVSQAEDAFGERIGTEQLGLYSESQVRGFSLQSAGNYRIDGHYFVREAQLPDSVLNGVSIHVGSSALRTEFPSPSGVVGLRLRKAPPGPNGIALETGLRRYETPFVQMDAWYASERRAFSVAGGAYASGDSNYSDGTHGDEYSIGAVPRWQIGGLTFTGLASGSRRRYNGDYRFVSAVDGALPPKLRGAELFGPPWAQFESATRNAGFAADYVGAHGWHLRGSMFWSENDQPAADFTILETDALLRARATTSLTEGQRSGSVSSELFLARQFDSWAGAQRIYGSIRHRESDSLSTAGETFEVGTIDLRDPRHGPRPDLGGSAVYRDTNVKQLTAALGWELNVAERVHVRLGAQRSDYRKLVESMDTIDSVQDAPWLYDFALIKPLYKNWIVYGSYTRGLEEQGVAPRNAANRNEVLPVIEAEQLELGLRGRVANAMSLVAAVFQISKPTAGFDEANRFGVVGDVRHRGLELSLTGSPIESLSLAAGFMALEPELTGQPVTSGRISSRPVGVQKIAAQMTAEYSLTSVPYLSIDVQVNHAGDRLASFDGALRTPARTTVNLGARYRFAINGFPAVLRMRVQNATDVHDWSAETSGLLSREQARSYTLSLAMTSVRDGSW